MSISIGIIGAGWFGREAHLKNLLRLDDAEVVALSSRSAQSRDAANQLAGGALRTFADWRDLLALDALDAVVIALPNDQHHAAVIAAARAGKHVLCEKPLGLSVAQCNDMIDAAAASATVLQVGHEMRHQALYRRMQSLIRSGAVGDPRIIWCRDYRGPMRTGWRSSERHTGGMLLEKNCHHFDLFNWMLGTAPLRVTAFGGSDVLTDREILDNAQVLVEHEGGRRAILEVCLFAPLGSDCEVGIVGSAGRIDTRNQALELHFQRFEPPERFEQLIPDPDDEAGFTDASGRVDRGIKAELTEFLKCCATGVAPLNDGHNARLNVAVCLAAQAAIKRGEVVTIEEMLNAAG